MVGLGISAPPTVFVADSKSHLDFASRLDLTSRRRVRWMWLGVKFVDKIGCS